VKTPKLGKRSRGMKIFSERANGRIWISMEIRFNLAIN